MQKRYDAVIIGAGIIGCSIALELSKRGFKTLNIDKLPSAGHGSTSNSCAVIRVHYSTLEGTAVALESYRYWDDWGAYLGAEDPGGLAKFIKRGILVFKSQANDELQKVKRILRELGIKFEDWDIDQIKEKFPIFNHTSYYPPRRPDDPDFGKPNAISLSGAVYYHEGGYVTDPMLSVHNIQIAAETHGAEFKFNTKVVDICRAQNRVTGVVTEDGTVIVTPIVVNAAGPHSFIINSLAGVESGMHIRTRALRHEVVHLPAPQGFDYEAIGCPSSDSDVGAYWRPEVGNYILTGSEDPDCDPKVWVEDPDNFNRNLTEQAKAQAYRLGLRIPGLAIPNRLEGVVDLYDVTDDWIPIYDKSDLPGFFMAIGTSGNQYKNAPVVGKIMAELIVKCTNGLDHDTHPLVFHLKNIDRDINLRFYSRLREINRESSFSVLG